jgi:hypothetical protein
MEFGWFSAQGESRTGDNSARPTSLRARRDPYIGTDVASDDARTADNVQQRLAAKHCSVCRLRGRQWLSC